MYKGKKVLVTGGTGMIGVEVVKMLLAKGANVRVASLDDPSRIGSEVEFMRGNLMELDFCNKIVKGMDHVFHVAGIKGAVSIGHSKSASFFVTNILMNTNMMEASYHAGVERYLFTSSIGVYSPVEIFYEDKAWDGPPHEADKYGAWAKRMGELQAETYKLQYGWDKIAIVRPANVYGPFDNFDPQTAMVVPALIARVANGENPLVVWGDGSIIRDFIFARDCAEGIVLALEHGANGTPINLGSGQQTTVKDVVSAVVSCFDNPPKVEWDITKPAGQPVRLMDMTRAKEMIGFVPKTSIQEGVRETVEWYLANRELATKRFNVFHEKSMVGKK